ncbi:MAG: TIGR02302 family protein [Pseudomonadota bacterium]
MTERKAPFARVSGFKIVQAKCVMVIETAWAAFWPVAALAAAFLTISLLGLWRLAPGAVHAAALLGLAAGFGVLLWRGASRMAWPRRTDALARLEEDGGLRHQPLQVLEDAPLAAAPEAETLWRVHTTRAAKAARAARVGRPRALVDAADPLRLRVAAGLALVASLYLVGGEAGPRLAEALRPNFDPAAGERVRLDAWLSPPAYTGAAPIYLARADGAGIETAKAPEGSVLSLRVTGAARPPRIVYETAEDAVDIAAAAAGPDSYAADIDIAASGTLTLRSRGLGGRWSIDVAPDAAPSAAFAGAPAATERGALRLAFSAADDYGVAAARLRLKLAPDQARPLDAPAVSDTALQDVFETEISIPEGRKEGDYAVDVDLTEHPWAGMEVEASVVVVDGKGQEGATAPETATLPEREFYYPLAKAVIEERRNLAVAPEAWPRTVRAFDALTAHAELFAATPTEHLLLRAAYWRVRFSEGAELDEAIERFWSLALQLEDGDLSLARRALEAALEALRAGIERNAPTDEISELIADARQAMDRYLKAMAAAAEAGELAEMEADGAPMSQTDLSQMLDAIKELTELGSRSAAEEMLAQLQDILNNLQMTAGGPGGEGGSGGQGESPAADALSELGDLIGRQRRLADETFERGQTGEGAEGSRGEGAAGDLAEGQGDLQGALQELMEALSQLPADGGAGEALGQAGDAMGEAGAALGAGDFDAAGAAQGEAVEALREGAMALARQMMEDMNGGEGGEGQARGPGTDPAGRPLNGLNDPGNQVDVPDVFDIERARALLEELRRRAGERGRSREELEYIERLLQQF